MSGVAPITAGPPPHEPFVAPAHLTGLGLRGNSNGPAYQEVTMGWARTTNTNKWSMGWLLTLAALSGAGLNAGPETRRDVGVRSAPTGIDNRDSSWEAVAQRRPRLNY